LPANRLEKVIGRWAAVDYGSRRIGLAISDSAGRVASPAGTLYAAASPHDDAQAVLAWACEQQVSGLVVGLPLNMDGSVGPQARRTLEFVAALRRAAGKMPVETWDERLTSFQADEWLRQQSVSRNARRRRRDALAALAILQSFLAARGGPS